MLKPLFNRNSLITRLIWLNILAVIAVSILIGLWARTTIIKDSQVLSIERQQMLNKRISTRIDDELIQRKERLQELTLKLSKAGQLKPLAEIQQLLDNRIWLHDAFNGGLIVVGIDGNILLDSPIIDQRVGTFLGDRQHFLSAKEYKKPFISKPLIGRAVKEPVYIISSPILDADGNFLGTVTGVTKLKDDMMLQKITQNYLGNNHHLYVLDLQNKIIVTSSNKELIMQPLTELKESGVIKEIINGKLSGESYSHFGGNVFYNASTLKETEWIIVNTYIENNWVNHDSHLIKEILWISLISMLIIVFISFHYLRHQLLPLQITTKKLIGMSQSGTRVGLINTNQLDEVGDLINAFNSLLKQLENNENEIIVAGKQAEAANQAKNQFLSNISHEIKTPLNAVLALTHIQLECTSDYDSRVRLEKIQLSSRALLSLFNNIFNFIETENKNTIIDISYFNLKTTLSDLVEEYTNLNTDKAITISFDIKDSVPIHLQGDKLHLIQVLGYLINNAVKFTEQGKIDIKVKKQTDAKPLQLTFSVSDTGQGISEEKTDQIFQAFKQIDESNHRVYGGIGMGLAISNRLVKLMGGEHINVKSELGKGSCFYFTLPLTIDNNYNPLEQKIKPNASTAKILIVDDNNVNREVVAALLSKYKLKYNMATNGTEAIDKLNKNNYDIIFMDLQMPIMDGYEATQKIRKFNKKVPIIALTATSFNQDRNKAFSVGMNAFLTKPIEPNLFYKELSNYLNFNVDQPSSVLEAPIPESITKNNPNEKEYVKKRILIVDDEITNLKILANALNKDYIIQVASQGSRALELCNGEMQPDLVLLDIQMPNMDGYELCRLLKEDPNTNQIPVIFVTALSTPESEEKGLNIGAVDYITKPYKMAVVKARIRTHIKLKQKTDLLEKLSYLDGLTSIANRRHFDLTLDNEINRLQRSNQYLGLIMIDIDYFKPYNDNYGHGKGDECLQQVAKALSDKIERSSDLLARYGGEEFVVISPETDAAGITALAEKLRATIDDLKLLHEHSAITDHITISLGCIAQEVKRSTRADTLLKSVDDALYEAKKRGRNQVVLAQQNTSD